MPLPTNNINSAFSRSEFAYTHPEGSSRLREWVNTTIVSDAEQKEIDRIIRYELFWQFYMGNHWREYNLLFTSFNYCGAFVNKVSQFLIGKKPFVINVESYEGGPVPKETEAPIEKLLRYHWRRNQQLLISYEMLQMGSVTGDCWVYTTWNPDKKCVDIRVLDSRHSFPEFRDGDIDNLESFMLRQPLEKNDKKYVLKVTRYTKSTVETWFQKTTTSKPKNDLLEYSSTANTLGFIPIVHIKNRPNSQGYYSVSDLTDLVKLNKMYNELAQELKAIIDYHVAPTTIVTGATITTLNKKIGGVWSGLPEGANVFNLGLDADLSEAREFMNLIKLAMHELGDVPENYLGKIQAISNTSAAALQLTYQPVIQKADEKWMMYGEGIIEINKNIIKICRVFDERNKAVIAQLDRLAQAEHDQPVLEEAFLATPVFSYGFPSDRSLELSVAEAELRLNISSKRRVMERLGVTNIEEVMEENKEERLEDARIEGNIERLRAIISGNAPLSPPPNGVPNNGPGAVLNKASNPASALDAINAQSRQ